MTSRKQRRFAGYGIKSEMGVKEGVSLFLMQYRNVYSTFPNSVAKALPQGRSVFCEVQLVGTETVTNRKPEGGDRQSGTERKGDGFQGGHSRQAPST